MKQKTKDWIKLGASIVGAAFAGGAIVLFLL